MKVWRRNLFFKFKFLGIYRKEECYGYLRKREIKFLIYFVSIRILIICWIFIYELIR